MQRVADCNHLIAGVHGARADCRDVFLFEFLGALQERKVVCFVGRDNAQLHRGLTGEIAVNIADAVANDVIVGDDVRVLADDEAAA